jgi:hypothetical protein
MWFCRAALAQALAGELDAIGVVQETVEDGVGDGGIADDLVPAIHGQLAGDDGGASLVAILDDLEQVAALLVVELLGSPVVEDEQVGPGEAAQHLGVAAVTACQGERGKQPGCPVIDDGEILAAGLVAERASQPAFADTGRPGEQQPMPGTDPLAAGKLEEEAAVQTAGGAEVDVLDAGLMAQTGGTGAGFEALLAAHRHLVVEQQGEPFGMLQGPGLGLGFKVLEGLRHAVQAEAGEQVAGRVDQHGGCPQWK